jgi:hypothetical protein
MAKRTNRNQAHFEATSFEKSKPFTHTAALFALDCSNKNLVEWFSQKRFTASRGS